MRGNHDTSAALSVALRFRRGLSPRVRGNRVMRNGPWRATARGLSPRVRGNHIMRNVVWRTTLRKVYPRACGGTTVCLRLKKHCRIMGLSPRVRGNRRIPFGAGVYHGSIPARAGEPKALSPCPPTTSVYPRACGGTTSSPERTARMNGLRSIPARAGEPTARRPPGRRDRVYSRACGGTRYQLLAAKS